MQRALPLACLAVLGALELGGVRGQQPATELLPAPPAASCPCGGPPPVARWAHPSNTPAYIGYYVGGGCPFCRHGEPRYPCEGTWGWDYSGWCFHRKVDLLWWHGRCYQGGQGAYRTEGPQPLKRLHEHCEDGH